MSNNSVLKAWELNYKRSGEELPWCLSEIPRWFREVIKSKWVKPCKTLDVGCGVGNYAGYLSKCGFDVLGVDFSHQAIILAKKKYPLKNLKFSVHNALQLSKLNEKFDFVYEVSLFHHIPPKDRNKYAKELCSVLNPAGKCLICCFSDKESFFEGKKKFDNPETNTITYPLSKAKLIRAFSKHFKIEKIKTIHFGKKSKRERYLCLMTKK